MNKSGKLNGRVSHNLPYDSSLTEVTVDNNPSNGSGTSTGGTGTNKSGKFDWSIVTDIIGSLGDAGATVVGAWKKSSTTGTQTNTTTSTSTQEKNNTGLYIGIGAGVLVLVVVLILVLRKK